MLPLLLLYTLTRTSFWLKRVMLNFQRLLLIITARRLQRVHAGLVRQSFWVWKQWKSFLNVCYVSIF